MCSVEDLRVALPWGVLYIGDDDRRWSAGEQRWDPEAGPYVDPHFLFLAACHEQHGPVLVRCAPWPDDEPDEPAWIGSIDAPSGQLRIGDLLDERQSLRVPLPARRCRVAVHTDPPELPDVVIVHVDPDDVDP